MIDAARKAWSATPGSALPDGLLPGVAALLQPMDASAPQLAVASDEANSPVMKRALEIAADARAPVVTAPVLRDGHMRHEVQIIGASFDEAACFVAARRIEQRLTNHSRTSIES